jgi:hypothetical protein
MLTTSITSPLSSAGGFHDARTVETPISPLAASSTLDDIFTEIRTFDKRYFFPLGDDKLDSLKQDISGEGVGDEPKALACLELAERLISNESFDKASILLELAKRVCDQNNDLNGTDFYYDIVLNLARIYYDGRLCESKIAEGEQLLHFLVEQFPDCGEASNYLK